MYIGHVSPVFPAPCDFEWQSPELIFNQSHARLFELDEQDILCIYVYVMFPLTDKLTMVKLKSKVYF